MKSYYAKCLNCEKSVHVTNKKRPQKFCSHYCSREFKNKIPVIGIRSNLLKVIEEVSPTYAANGNPIRMVMCVCDCGNYRVKQLASVKSGIAKSCGCLNKVHIRKIQSAFLKHNLCGHPLHNAWGNMKQRCFNNKCKSWKYYGGRGVKICDEWVKDFKAFYNWAINNGWQKGLHLDKDILGDGLLYSPYTCCFITKSKNSENTRKVRYIDYDGVRMSLANLSKKYKLPRYVIIKRIKLNWDLYKVFNTPVKIK